MVKSSIWRDTVYTSSADTLEYTIELNDSVIFKGTAYKLPNTNELKINVNKVCQNYLSQNIDELLNGEEVMTANDACKTFQLRQVVSNSKNTLESYQFLYDWSYVPWDGNSATLSKPINKHYADGMMQLLTTVSEDGIVTNSIEGDYDKRVNCADYALYYLNSYGGWDSFLIEGKVVKRDSITQYTTDKAFNNTTREFENNRYLSEIVTSYEMHTGYLNDKEAANYAKNLVSSNKVYIHNLSENTIVPAVITDSSIDYLTFKNNGDRLVSYTLNIKESQSKLRR